MNVSEIIGKVKTAPAYVKEHWNKGIGTQLLHEIIEFAKDNQFEIIDLQVRSDNAPAIHLYEKYGFRERSVIMTLDR